jgi:hypothetical protein
VANASETLTRDWIKIVDSRTIDLISFVSTFLVNVPLGVWKDLRFAKFYGIANSARATTINRPRPDLRLPTKANRYSTVAASLSFLLRDAITIFGSFKLAPSFAEYFTLANISTIPHTCYIVSQLVVPAMTQLFATPLHLLGLDLYRQHREVTLSERLIRIGRDAPSVTLVRSCRILPAFGAGCVANTELRSSFHNMAQPGKLSGGN